MDRYFSTCGKAKRTKIISAWEKSKTPSSASPLECAQCLCRPQDLIPGIGFVATTVAGKPAHLCESCYQQQTGSLDYTVVDKDDVNGLWVPTTEHNYIHIDVDEL
jgi:hypothetical protein